MAKTEKILALRHFVAELRRRRVIRVLVMYAIGGWAIIQIASTVLPGLNVPDWSITLVIALVALGLPLALILAWAFDVTDGAIRRAPAADAQAGAVPPQDPPYATPPAKPAVSEATSQSPAATTFASTDTRVESPSHRGDRRSIAVLPFANLTGDPSKDYLADGLAEELIHTLAGVPGLRVPSRTSSFAYRGHDIDLRRIANELEVGAVLEGSVRAAGERIRITAQLIDGASGYHLWSQHYDRRFDDLFELQDDLAAAIILQTLNVTLEGPAQRRLLRSPPTRNLEAYQLFLEAMAEQARGSVRSAFDKLHHALQIDPGFAQARAAVVVVRSVALFQEIALPGSLADAEREARQALDLQPDSASTYAALGTIRATQARWLEAEASFRRALELDDTDPWAWSAHGLSVFTTVGYVRAYLSSSSEAHRLAPAWLPAHLQLTSAHLRSGNYQEASDHARAAMELGMPRTRFPLADALSHIEMHAGHFDAARELMQGACMATMGLSRELQAVDRVFDALSGRAGRAAAVAALDVLRAEAGTGLHQVMRRRLLVWYSMLEAFDQAYELMNRTLDELAEVGTIGGGWAALWAQEVVDFRADPRFAALATRMRLPEYWERYGPPDGYEWRGNRLLAR